MEMEMEKLDFQARLRKREAKEKERRKKQNDGHAKIMSDLIGKAVGKVPKMLYFDEERDFMDTLGVLSVLLRLRSGRVSVGLCTSPYS